MSVTAVADSISPSTTAAAQRTTLLTQHLLLLPLRTFHGKGVDVPAHDLRINQLESGTQPARKDGQQDLKACVVRVERGGGCGGKQVWLSVREPLTQTTAAAAAAVAYHVYAARHTATVAHSCSGRVRGMLPSTFCCLLPAFSTP